MKPVYNAERGCFEVPKSGTSSSTFREDWSAMSAEEKSAAWTALGTVFGAVAGLGMLLLVFILIVVLVVI